MQSHLEIYHKLCKLSFLLLICWAPRAFAIVDGYDWTWISGTTTLDAIGTYGIQGTPSSSNIPGARTAAVGWIDSKYNFWLFGGSGIDSNNNAGLLNDLWKYDGNTWTWISGNNTKNATGFYGTQGISSPANTPGARESATGWIDSKYNFWLFGGYGVSTNTNNAGPLNDLWKFDGNNWTWISGTTTLNAIGTYGIQGTPSPSNIPGARSGATVWIDSKNNFWLFGGNGIDSNNNAGALNDLWMFNGNFWTWIYGSTTKNATGFYGTQGISSSANIPGARVGATGWIDSKNNFWLFGGGGITTNINYSGLLNDLWKFTCPNCAESVHSSTLSKSTHSAQISTLHLKFAFLLVILLLL
jgi:hypothetical protein